jgi:hypothetical protein
MDFLGILAVFVFALFVIQICYIYLYYSEIQEYNRKYDAFYYGIDIVPNYIDPSTTDPNDLIVEDIRFKWRCVVYGSGYTIASLNGFKVDPTTGVIAQFLDMITCQRNLFMYLDTYSTFNPCLLNPNSLQCSQLKDSLIS